MALQRSILASAALVALLALTALPAAADRVEEVLPLPGRFDGALEKPGDGVTLGFLVNAGEKRRVIVSVRRGRRSKIEPDVRLVAPSGQTFDVVANGGRVRSSKRAFTAILKTVPSPETGLWRVEIGGANDSVGAFKAKVVSRDVNKVSGTATVPLGSSFDIPFVAGNDTEVLVRANRRRGSTVSPQIQLLDPNGVMLEGGDFLGRGNSRRGRVTLSRYRLPVFGTYTARISGEPGTGGEFSYVIVTKPTRLRGALPAASAGSSFAAEPGVEVTLQGTTDAVSSVSYLWTQVSGPAVELSGRDQLLPMFVAPDAPTTLAFQLNVTSAGKLSRSSTVAVHVATRPLADAGRTLSVDPQAVVGLDGTGSLDRAGSGLSYSWRQDPGDPTQVGLDDPTSPTPGFEAPVIPAMLHFLLTVDDGTARSAEDQVVVAVGTNTAVADAGREQVVSRMASVRLSGLASLNVPGGLGDGALLWEQVGTGPAVDLQGADTPWPAFTAPRFATDLRFRVTVGGTASTADEVQVHVRPNETNLPAPARSSGSVTLDSGNAPLSAAGTTDPDGDTLTYRWAQLTGIAAPPANPLARDTTAPIPQGSELRVYGVQANDGLQYGDPERLPVVNTTYAGGPVADAGPDQAASSGTPVTLDGTGSRLAAGDMGVLTFAWEQASGRDWFDVAAEDGGFDPTASRPAFTIPSAVSSLTPTRTISFRLVVRGGAQIPSEPDLMTLTFAGLPVNGIPEVTAAASETNPVAGQIVTLNGTEDDRDGDDVTVRWSQTSGPVAVLLPNNTVLAPQFTAPASGTLVFQIVGNDGFDDSLPAEVTIVVDAKPEAVPTIDPTSGDPGEAVTVDGSGSFDPEGETVTYAWEQTMGTSVTFDDTAESFLFLAPQGGVTFKLTVNDGRQDSEPAFVSFSAEATPEVNPTTDRSNAPYGATVRLSANPPAMTSFTFQWRQIDPGGTDPTVTFSSATLENPTFTVPLPPTGGWGASPQATFGVTASNGGQTSTEKTVTVTFYASLNDTAIAGSSNTVYSFISSNCSSCHFGTSNFCNTSSRVGSGNNASGLGMGTKAGFLANTKDVAACFNSGNRITTSSPSSSDLLKRVKGTAKPTMPPKGGTPLTTGQIAILEDWILQGCKDN